MITVSFAVPSEMNLVRALFREYAESLGVSLAYQGFEEELRELPGAYAGPKGVLLLALDGTEAMGCVAVRPLEVAVAEMKRLYVRPAARGLGLGRRLAEAAVQFARDAGYERLRLDTLPQMQAAQAMYAAMGFRTIDPYRYSAVAGTVFMELGLKER